MNAPLYLSDSQRSTFQLCPQRWAWKYLYPGGKEQDTTNRAATWSSQVVHPLLAAALSRQPLPLPTWNPEPLETLYTTPMAVRVVETYLQEQDADVEQYTVLGVEVDCTREIFPGVQYRSIADVLLQDKDTGEKQVLDWKTSKYEPGEKYSLPYLQQQMGQVVVHEAVGWLVSHFRLKVGKLKVGVEHSRFGVRVREDHRTQWVQGIRVVHQQIQECKEEGIFPRNSDSCFAFGKPCPYLSACHAGDFSGELTKRWAPLQQEVS